MSRLFTCRCGDPLQVDGSVGAGGGVHPPGSASRSRKCTPGSRRAASVERWPLPWSWTLWTIVVLLWCGRSSTDCATWLVQQAHINPLQLDTMGFGSAHPLVRPSKDPTAQAANRRVEVISLH